MNLKCILQKGHTHCFATVSGPNKMFIPLPSNKEKVLSTDMIVVWTKTAKLQRNHYRKFCTVNSI